MKRIFGILAILSLTLGSHAQTVHNVELAYVGSSTSGSLPEIGINIYPTVVGDILNIEVDDKLAGGKVTVSIFNAIGEVVLEETLGLGLNKLKVGQLAKGNYVAVVRENDQYKNKSGFEVM